MTGFGEGMRPQQSQNDVPKYSRKMLERDLVALRPEIKKWAFMCTRDVHEADDLVQETIEHALGADQDQFDGRNIKGWVRTIMNNLHTDKLRKYDTNNVVRGEEAEKIIASREGDPASTLGLNPEAALQAKQQSVQLARAMNRLSTNQKISIELAAEGKPYTEIGKEIGVMEGTVTTHVARARKKLRKILNLDDFSDRK